MTMQDTYQSDSTYSAVMNSRNPDAMLGYTTPVSRRAEEYRLTFHALERMEQRGIATKDIEHIIQKGKIICLEERIGFRIDLEEISEKEANFEELERLKDAVVIVKPDETIIITVRPYGTNIYNYCGDNSKNGYKKQFGNGWLPYDFKYPSDLLFTFQSTQEKELLGITSNDIKRIICQGWRSFKWRTLCLFEPLRYYFDNNQQPHMKGTTMVIDRKHAAVVNFLKSDPFQFLFSNRLNIH